MFPVAVWGCTLLKNEFCSNLKTNAKETMWASEVDLINGDNYTARS